MSLSDFIIVLMKNSWWLIFPPAIGTFFYALHINVEEKWEQRQSR